MTLQQPALPARVRPELLIVDDDAAIRRLLARVLHGMCPTVHEAGTAEEAAQILRSTTPDIILLDVNLPDRPGHVVLHQMREDPQLRMVPVIMLTGGATREDRLRAIEAGVTDFISKPFDAEELRARVGALLRLKSLTDSFEEAERVLVLLARAIDARSPHTFGHSSRVSSYAGQLAEAAGLTDEAVRIVRQGSLFHDFGKIAIRDAVLLKAAPLTEAEFEEMKRHPGLGCDLLRHLRTMGPVLPIVHDHHERLDGTGYPQGFRGDQIALEVRIVSIADVFDALTSTRPYRPAWEKGEALEILAAETRKGWWDSDLLTVFRAVVEHRPGDALRTA